MDTRVATVADAGAIGRIHVASWRATYRGLVPDSWLDAQDEGERAASWRRDLAAGRPDHHVLVAERDGAVYAFAGGRVIDLPRRRILEVEYLHVALGHHGGGTGRRLLVELAAWGEARGCSSVELGMVAGNPAGGFYERLGGRVYGRVSDAIDGRLVTDVLYRWDDIRTLSRGGEGR